MISSEKRMEIADLILAEKSCTIDVEFIQGGDIDIIVGEKTVNVCLSPHEVRSMELAREVLAQIDRKISELRELTLVAGAPKARLKVQEEIRELLLAADSIRHQRK